jgi:hypothetical protein
MRGVALVLLAGLAACGERGAETSAPTEARAIARSVDDIRAAEAAKAAPVAPSKTIAELTRPAAKAAPEQPAKAKSAG